MMVMMLIKLRARSDVIALRSSPMRERRYCLCLRADAASGNRRKEGSLQIGGNQIKEFVSSKFEEQNNLKREKSPEVIRP